MKILIAIAVTLILPAFSSALDLPKRKPGLWEVSIVNSRRPEPMVMKQCTDEHTDEKMMGFGRDMMGRAGVNCAKNEMHQEGGAYVGETDCTMMGSHMQGRSAFKGDFNSAYTGEVHATYDPPLMGMKESTMTINGKWVGACSADQKPGDIITDKGMKLNVDMLSKGAPGMNAAIQSHQTKK